MLFLGPFEKLRKATISFLMSVRPSARNNSAPIEGICIKFGITGLFKNLLKKKIKFRQNLTRITVLCMETDIHFPSYLAQFFLE